MGDINSETKKMAENSSVPLSGMKKKVVGYLSALCVSFSAAIVIVSSQLLGDAIPPFQTNFVRFILQTIIAILGLVVTKTNPKLPLEWKPVIVITSAVVLNFGAGVLFIVSAWYLPAALVQGILESSIMTLSGILAIFRKKCTIDLPFAIVLCYIGCTLMIQPPGMFNTQIQPAVENCTVPCDYCQNTTYLYHNSTTESCKTSQGRNTLYGVLATIGLALCLWFHAQFNVEQLSKWINVVSILFWLGIGCSLLSVPVLAILRMPVVFSSPADIGLQILFGLAFTANIFFIMYAVTLLPLSHVAVVLPSGLVFLYIFQKTILKHIQPGPDNWIAILGLVITVVGAILSPTCDIIRERKKSSVNDDMEDEQLGRSQMDEETMSLMNKADTKKYLNDLNNKTEEHASDSTQ